MGTIDLLLNQRINPRSIGLEKSFSKFISGSASSLGGLLPSSA
jgi:hypothetical protein